MRKIIAIAVVVTLAMFATSAFAVTPPTTTTGAPVALTAIIPSYIGFLAPNVSSVTFDFSALGLNVATGLNITKLAPGTNPSWTLMYNLAGKPTVTVCAYVTPLAGSGTNSFAFTGADLYAAPNGGASAQFNATGCGQTGNAVVMDTISSATFNTGKSEAFSGMFLQTPGGGVVPPPDTYTGTLTIVAQVQ